MATVRPGRRWFGDEVHEYSGSLAEIAGYLPTFRRQPLALMSTDGTRSTINWHRDLIVRCGRDKDEDDVPIGLVSKQYQLVQHTDVLACAARALQTARISSTDIRCEMSITSQGERMALRLLLPPRYDFDPGDGQPMGLRLECFNSVEGSSRFMAVLGWLRFICQNGLIVGISRATIRDRHDEWLDVDDLDEVLAEGLRAAEKEKALLLGWLRQRVEEGCLRRWVNGPLASTWGKKAAARAYHILRTGRDADFEDPFERAKPTERHMKPRNEVPGAATLAATAFAVSQALAWLAQERRDIQEQLEWRRQIPRLIESLQT